MKLEGRIALGLDEFMLRLGHLKMLLGVLQKTHGNRARIARRLAETLTELVEVRGEDTQNLGAYLTRKKLCAVVHPDGSVTAPHPKARYSHLRVTLDALGRVTGIEGPRDGPLRVWFQDFSLADPRTASKVGAVTADTREISNKSGVSHLVDWASVLEIANKRLGLTATGRALATICGRQEAETEGSTASNPYVIGYESLALSWIMFMADGDVLARLISRLSKITSLGKADAIELVSELCNEMDAEARRGGSSASVTAVRAVRDFQRDLGIHSASRRAGPPSSTAWHRISSRLESLTDLGFLQKTDPSGARRDHDYYYRPTEALIRASASLGEAGSPSDWADNQLSEILAPASSERPSARSCGPELLEAVRLCLGPTGIHIDSFALVAATLALMHGKLLSPAEARERLRDLALGHPDIARLSRGYAGSRAEFASISVAKLDQVGASGFYR